VVDRVLDHGVVLFSEDTMNELTEVLSRSKFDCYVSRKDRALFLAQLSVAAEFVPIVQLIRECRDPKDDKFLEVALNGRAEAIITGDADLLRMHPWREVEILSPIDYLRL
jgi:putative PIN family toxin of toxin-antitoxin system